MVFAAQKTYQQLLDHTHNDLFIMISSSFDLTHQRVLQGAKDNDLAVWLSITPVQSNHFGLSAQEFRDALAIRYHNPPFNLPPKFDGCCAASSLDHFWFVEEVTLLSSITMKSGMPLVTWWRWLRGKYDMKLWLLRLRISMMRPLLLICMFVGFGCHTLRCCLI